MFTLFLFKFLFVFVEETDCVKEKEVREERKQYFLIYVML